MEPSTEEKTLTSISQTDFLNFIKEKQIDIEGSNTETMFESFLIFQKFMNVMFRKPTQDPQSDKKKSTDQHSIDKEQGNLFPLTEELNLAAENTSQQMHNINSTIEDINYHININRNKEEDNANGKCDNQLTLETQNEVKTIEDFKDKDIKDNKSYLKQYASYDDIPIKPSTINFVELVEKNLAELQYQSEPKNDKEHSKGKRIHHRLNNKKKPLKNKPRSHTVKEKEKKKEMSPKQDSKTGYNTLKERKKRTEKEKEKEKKSALLELKLRKSNSIENKDIENEIKEDPKREEEEERPSVLPVLIQDELGEDNEKEEEYLSNINKIEKEKEKIVPELKKDELFNSNRDRGIKIDGEKNRMNDMKNDDNDCNDVEELGPDERKIKKHIDYVDEVSGSDSFLIILPEYDKYEAMENNNNNINSNKNNNNSHNIQAPKPEDKDKEDSQSDSEDIIINCDSDEEEVNNDYSIDNKKLIIKDTKDSQNTANKDINKELLKLNEEKQKVSKLKQDYEKMKQLLKTEINQFNETKKREYALIEKMKTEDHSMQIKTKPSSNPNITPPPMQKQYTQYNIPSNQCTKDKSKEQIEQLKTQIRKLQEDHKIKENKSKMTIEKLKKQLQEANTQVSEYIKLTKGRNNIIKQYNANTNISNNIKANNYNGYHSNSIDNQDHMNPTPASNSKKESLNHKGTKQKIRMKKDSNNSNMQKKNSNFKDIAAGVNDADETYDIEFPSKYNLSNDDVVIAEDKTSDGKHIKMYSNKMKEIVFASGVIKKIYEDGYQIIFFTNNDIKQIYPNGKSMYYYSESNVTQTILPNDLHIYKLANGSIEKHYPNGYKEIFTKAK